MSTFYGRDCSRLAKSWVRAVLRRAARVIVLSAHWRDVVRQIEPAARTTVIGNPVAVPMRLAPLRQPARTVLFLAWLQKDKGLFDLIAAMPFVLRHVPEARFVLAGSGNIDAVVQLARALGVEHTLLLPGWVNGNEKDDLLGQSDVFALPSYYEGLPVGVLEAMARGVPVVTTPVGGVPDVIKDGVNGLLVEPGQPKALARAIVALLTDDGLRQRLREAAHRQVGAKYSSEKVVDAIGALYRDLGIGVETVKRQAASYT